MLCFSFIKVKSEEHKQEEKKEKEKGNRFWFPYEPTHIESVF